MSNYMPYPEHAHSRTGCKVGWRYYDNEADAKACSVAAVHNGRIDAGRGYDFGYCAPGSIRPPRPGTDQFHADFYEVCIP